MNRKRNKAGGHHRLTPIWKDKVDREGLARVLLLLAMHLGETRRAAHTRKQKSAPTAEQKGGGHDEKH